MLGAGAAPSGVRTFACPTGLGIAVAPDGDVVVVSCSLDMKLYVYSITDGALVRSICGKGSGKGQLGLSTGMGGVCFSHPTDGMLRHDLHSRPPSSHRSVYTMCCMTCT